jgi:hypothetical protein
LSEAERNSSVSNARAIRNDRSVVAAVLSHANAACNDARDVSLERISSEPVAFQP